MDFKVEAPYGPGGDQPSVIQDIAASVAAGYSYQTVLGATGTGKTYVMAKIIEKLNRPALIISHNKTLAAQLYKEFQQFFPNNAVEYFVSYFDYYQPEAYVFKKDLYIEKDSSVNEEIEKLRIRATSSLLERRDVVIVASVSCIYGLGSPEDYKNMHLHISLGDRLTRGELSRFLVNVQYSRNDETFTSSTFRIRGDVIDIYPPYFQDEGYRIELFGDEVEAIHRISVLNNKVIGKHEAIFIYPAKHFVMPQERVDHALIKIDDELKNRLKYFEKENKLLEKERLFTRTKYDMEMMGAMGFCNGIENYSRHLTGRKAGEPPYTLLDYFPEDFVTFVDESHVSVPQINGMYNGDQSRKRSLVDHGFRLPSALDNRPLHLQEFWNKAKQAVFVSATPGDYEKKASKTISELIIRPTGLIDPEIEIRPTEGQVDDLLGEAREAVKRGHRILVTTLTKKMAEDLTHFLMDHDVKVNYLHSDIETIERVEIIKSLRLGEIDVLVGINLLREGIDLPEVALVAIFDADKVGFLRSTTSLIQTVGRAARNSEGRVIMYADRTSEAMKACIKETDRRRERQVAYNEKHGVTPTTIIKPVDDILIRTNKDEDDRSHSSIHDLKAPKDRKAAQSLLKKLDLEMNMASDALDFEKAIELREKIKEIKTSLKIR